MHFPDWLKGRLKKSLPGIIAHKKMMAVPENSLRFNINAREGARESGVLVLLYQKEDRWHFPLILRREYGGTHSGQVSFPGGRKEDSDDSLEFTARRETEEEIGIKSTHVEILGALTELFIPVSNYLVHPYVGIIDFVPDFIPEEREVSRIIEAPLSSLVDPDRIKSKTIRVRNYNIIAPYFDIQDEFVWGATAMILGEVKELLEEWDLQ